MMDWISYVEMEAAKNNINQNISSSPFLEHVEAAHEEEPSSTRMLGKTTQSRTKLTHTPTP